WAMLIQIGDVAGFYQPEEFGLFKVQNWAIGFWLPLLVLVLTRFHKVDKSMRSYPLIVAVLMLSIMLMLISLITGGANEFIYFQF
ncbi:MAG: hypothetical protein KC964_20880, partial [Candidatus Omnitrophica bacterium]|nr:hypothetical protein [Candidatus Omnitrophota bacterium]